MRIHPKINSETNRSKIHHTNKMLQTMGNTHLNLRGYARMYTTIHCGPNQQHNVMHDPLVANILIHYHVSEGLKVFCEPGVSAILKYLKQLHDRIYLDPNNAEEISKGQKKSALQYLFFSRQKRCRKIKGWSCADRIKHHDCLIKNDTC